MPRDVFGEVALVDKTPRACTVVATEESVVWALSAAEFKSTLTKINASRFQEDMKFVSSVPLFAKLDQFELANLCECMS
jgi:CRP-like cAMP-binding protein